MSFLTAMVSLKYLFGILDSIMDRSKRILTLALNKELAFKVNSYKRVCKQKRHYENKSDGDYEPNLKKMKENDSKKNTIIILNDVKLLYPTAAAATGKVVENRNHPGTENEHKGMEIIVDDIIENIMENVFNKVDKDRSQEEETFEIVQEIVDIILERVDSNKKSLLYTNKGEIRKRRKFDVPPKERKSLKLKEKVQGHGIKKPCREMCTKGCAKKITYARQKVINNEYWQMNTTEQSTFVYNNVSQEQAKGRTSSDSNSRRSKTFKYYLPDEKGTTQEICKVFFLSTLGYISTNDRIIRNAVSGLQTTSIKPLPCRKIGNENAKKIDRKLIITAFLVKNIVSVKRSHCMLVKFVVSIKSPFFS